MGLTLCVHPGDGGTVVSVSGELDASTEESLQELLLRIMRAHGPRLLLDLSGVSFMDCAGLSALVGTRRRAELRSGSVRLIAASAAVRQVIDLTGMRNAFPVRDRRSHSGGSTSIPLKQRESHAIDPSTSLRLN
jgi:anti-anti-sigma factor